MLSFQFRSPGLSMYSTSKLLVKDMHSTVEKTTQFNIDSTSACMCELGREIDNSVNAINVELSPLSFIFMLVLSPFGRLTIYIST